MAVILDARTRAPEDGSHIAAWKLENKPVLFWQLELLESAGATNVVVLGDRDAFLSEAGALWASFAANWETPEGLSVKPGDIVIDVADVHRWDRLKKILSGKLDPVSGRIFRFQRREDAKSALDEWARNLWAPIGRFYVRPLAHRLAALLRNTPIHPNQVTLGTLACAVISCLALAFDVPGWRFFTPVLVIGGWILDWTDGRLSRLKNCRSRFGGWLDSTVGDLTEDLYYVGIVLYLHWHGGALAPWAFVAGTLYFFGKYQAYLSLVYHRKFFLEGRGEDFVLPAPVSRKNPLLRAFVIFEDADIRLHFLALSLLLGMPAVALVFYAAHFHLRWMTRAALVVIRNCK